MNGPDDHLPLCCACQTELDDLSLRHHRVSYGSGDETLKVNVLYLYDGIVRRLIHRAKISCDYQSFNLITALVARRAETIMAAQCATTVLPVPSSLWGRLRGRFDLADGMAESLAIGYKLRLQRPPLRLYWRVRKRAMMAAEHRLPRDKHHEIDDIAASALLTAENHDFLPPMPTKVATLNLARAILVDDVITSGTSMRETAAALRFLPRPASFSNLEGLVMALAGGGGA